MSPILNKVFLLSLIAGAALVACSDDDDSPSSPATNTPAADGGASSSGSTSSGSTSSSGSTATDKDIVDTAVGAGNFKTLVTAVQAAGLESTLRGTGPFTVFAPNDDAFGKLPPFLLTKLTSAPYKTELALILKYHVLSGSVKAADVLGKTQSVDTVQGAKLEVNGADNKVVLNGSINVVSPDIAAKNGIVHAVDGVLLPTIVDTAAGYDDGTAKFSILVDAVKKADLVTTLTGPGPFTVFAPTDAAFNNLKTALGDAAFNAILADKTKLTKILTYHVVSGAVYQKDVTTSEATTVQGQKLKLTVAGDKVTIGDSTANVANVALSDLPNRNGVIHAIDKVLLPAD